MSNKEEKVLVNLLKVVVVIVLPLVIYGATIGMIDLYSFSPLSVYGIGGVTAFAIVYYRFLVKHDKEEIKENIK